MNKKVNKSKSSKGSKSNKSKDIAKTYNEEYGYDFVAELAHFTNIDEQRQIVKRLEKGK